MYFTDKFPRAELKTLHTGLIKQSPGRKQPVIHKNITSNDFQFLSKVYSQMAFAKYPAVSSQPPSQDTLKEIFDLQQEIRDKDRKILQIRLKAEGLADKVSVGQGRRDYEEYASELKEQILERKKLDEIEKRQKKAQVEKRLEDLKREKEEEEKRRKRTLERTLEYKNVLETQKNLRKNIEFSASQMFPGLRTGHKSLFDDRKYESLPVPEYKNNNQLTVSLSSLPEFYQTKYTKRHPKLMKSNPITGESE